MTMGGVEALAAEVGIAPGLVKAAAKSMATPSGGPVAPIKWSRVLGAPTTLLHEREIDGELPESEFPVLVEEIRRILQNVGQVSQLGRSFSWQVTHSAGMRRDMQVAVSVRSGKTKITVRENLAPVIGVTVGALNAPLALIAVIPVWLGLTYLTARTFYQRNVAKRQYEFGQLADRLAELTAELVADQRRALRSGR
ncbi:MAG: hypothetical protein ACHQXA_09310, partial [Gemmatimonadales bacterium]